MPRIPLEKDHCQCGCDQRVVIKDSGDQKFIILENKLVPRNLDQFDTIETFDANTFIYVDDNGEPRKIKATDLSAKLSSSLTTTESVGGIGSGEVFEEGTPIESILRRMLVTTKQLSRIDIEVPPTKINYTVGEVFNPAGMVVKASYSNGEFKQITNYTYSPTGPLSLTDNTITVSYTEGSITKTDTQTITVVSDGIKVYKGLTSVVPSTKAEVESLTLDQGKSKSVLLTDGYVWKNVSPNNQFMILAIPEDSGLVCYDIKANGYSVDCIQDVAGGYYIYHQQNPATGSYRMVYSFEEDE